MTTAEKEFLEIENNKEREFQERLLRSRIASAKVIDKFNKQLEWDEKYWWVYVSGVVIVGSIIGTGLAFYF
jgi:hypothetical protein